MTLLLSTKISLPACSSLDNLSNDTITGSVRSLASSKFTLTLRCYYSTCSCSNCDEFIKLLDNSLKNRDTPKFIMNLTLCSDIALHSAYLAGNSKSLMRKSHLHRCLNNIGEELIYVVS